MRTFVLIGVALPIALPVWADTYWVTTLADSGAGSLRQAITDANAHVGADTVAFRKRFVGKAIILDTALPTVTDGYTTIEGEIDGDGAPDIALNGISLSSGNGLTVAAQHCTISGLTLMSFPDNGVQLANADYAIIRSCNIGVKPDGAAQAQCTGHELLLQDCDYCTIGAPGAARNVFTGGKSNGTAAIVLQASSNNTIAGNYIGITRDGSASLGFGYTGITLSGTGAVCSGNTIGGTTVGQRNVFGHLGWGVKAVDATDNRVLGNYIGLLPDGTTGLSVTMSAVELGSGCSGNTIGGTTPGARNVCVGSGVDVLAGAGSNTVRGNYFGFTADGTQQKEMYIGVLVSAIAPQTIGGNAPEAGNWFAGKGLGYVVKYGVALSSGGGGSLVRYNHFGEKPAGGDATGLDIGIGVIGVAARLLDNDIANAWHGIECVQIGATPAVVGNAFRNCGWAVEIQDSANPSLGNLSDASPDNDGGNTFDLSNSMFIDNDTPNPIRAENNDFGTTSKWEINARINDRKDDPLRGAVDFSPLAGGVLPTEAAVMVNGAAAIPSRNGAEVVFSLSAPAEVSVTVLNLAGRPVATVCADRPTEAGLQRLVWNGRSDQGTTAPGGVYLLRIAARDSGGRQAAALARLWLGR